MMILSVVLMTVLVVFATYTVLAPLVLNFGRFDCGFALHCPDRQEGAVVEVRAAGAAISSAYGEPSLKLRHCSLLGPGEVCQQACLQGIAA
jgi:hypothetical protein